MAAGAAHERRRARRTSWRASSRQGQGIGFAVLGGVFAEGVDLPGSRLIGAFIATLGLPPVSPMQDQMQARLDKLFGAGHGYADLVPAMQKVVQAAGRVLRTPEDRGWLWLLDDRYRRAEVIELLPPWWQLARSPAGARGAAALISRLFRVRGSSKHREDGRQLAPSPLSADDCSSRERTGSTDPLPTQSRSIWTPRSG